MKRFVLSLAAGLLAASPALAEVWTIDKVHSEASFKIRHLTGNVRGRFNDFEGTINADPAKPEAGSVDFKMKAASIDTKVDDRDNHLRSPDFFNVEKYPDITFKSSKITAKGNNQFDVTGTLTMHGVSQEIVLPVMLLGTGKSPQGNDMASFEILTKLNRKDYGIVWNRALDAGGVVLGDEVTVEINLETFVKKPEPAAK